MSTEQKEELKIKDLLIKLQVLRNALVEEKKKTQTYSDKIKEYEETIQKKDNEIVDLSKEKFSLKSKLTMEQKKQTSNERQGSILGNLLNKININGKPMDDSKQRKYEDALEQQNIEIKSLSQQLMEEKESFDQQKMKFQTEITVQNQKITELTKKNELIEKENSELKNSKDIINSMKQNFESQKAAYEEKFQKYEKEKTELEYKANEVYKRLEEYQKLYNEKDKENNELKKQINELSVLLNNMKTEMVLRQLSSKTYKVEKVNEHGIITTNKKPMSITFQYNKEKNICEVVFKRNKQKGLVEEHVNIIDISKFEVNEKNPNKVDISFMLDGEQHNYSVLVHEMVIDLLFQTYREFLTTANGGY